MILEGIVTTLGADDRLNIAPMGPIVDTSMAFLHLRPFRTSTTYQNLKARPYGVFHVIDDVLLIAQSALSRLNSQPDTFPATRIAGQVLADCSRWYEFEVVKLDDSNERTSIETKVVHVGRVKDLFGFNRAKHAVLEATILATRLHLLPESSVRQQMVPLASAVEKTAGQQERTAFDLVVRYVDEWYRNNPSARPE
jgi:hypothetical protein